MRVAPGVTTSVKRARRRLRYESWHLLHLYAYLGVGLALPHQLWTGQEFLLSPARTLYWWGLWIAATAAVVVWRLLLPVGRSLVVTSVVRESSDVVSVHLIGRRLDRLPLRAGQFLNVRFLDGQGWTVPTRSPFRRTRSSAPTAPDRSSAGSGGASSTSRGAPPSWPRSSSWAPGRPQRPTGRSRRRSPTLPIPPAHAGSTPAAW